MDGVHRKYSVCISARNEASNIAQTLRQVQNQTVPPSEIIVLNDGSTDNTQEVLDGIDDLTVLSNPPREESYLFRSEMAGNVNRMFECVNHENDYLLKLDADTILPRSYCGKIMQRMELHGAVIASGTYGNLRPKMPWYGARMYDMQYLEEIGFRMEETYFAEHWIVVQALVLGHDVAIYYDLPLRELREIGSNYNSKSTHYRGKACRAGGFSFWYAAWRAIRLGRGDRMSTYHFLRGYLSGGISPHPQKIKKWNRRYQNAELRRKLFKTPEPFLERLDNGLIVKGSTC